MGNKCKALREQGLPAASGLFPGFVVGLGLAAALLPCGRGWDPSAGLPCRLLFQGTAGERWLDGVHRAAQMNKENGRDNLMPSGTTEATLLLVSSYSPHCGELARLVSTWWGLFCVIVQSTISSESPPRMKKQDKDARNISVQAIKYGCRLKELACRGGDAGRKFFSAQVAPGSRGGQISGQDS